jgi:hypothetical protein
MTTTDRTDRRYLDQLAHHLQTWDVPGTRIGEIVAEAEAHAAASGEPLREAFGDPRDYARRWAELDGRRRRPRRLVLPYTAATTAGGFALGVGTTAIATDGTGATAFGLPAVAIALLGAALMVAAMLVVPVTRVRDPRTGAERGPTRLLVVAPMIGAALLLLGAGYAFAVLR